MEGRHRSCAGLASRVLLVVAALSGDVAVSRPRRLSRSGPLRDTSPVRGSVQRQLDAPVVDDGAWRGLAEGAGADVQRRAAQPRVVAEAERGNGRSILELSSVGAEV